MVELLTYIRTDSLGTPGRQKPSQVLRKWNETNKKYSCPWERKDWQQWVPQNWSHKSLDLERKGQHEILPSSLNQALQRNRRTDSSKNCHPSQASASFPRIPSSDSGVSGFKIQTVALISTRIWQGFLLILILVSPWLFKGIIGSSLLENPSESCQLWEGLIWGLSFEVGYGGIRVGVKEFDKIFEDKLFSSVPVNCKWDRFPGQCFDDGPLGKCNEGGTGVLAFWPWSLCSCKATNLVDFGLGSCSLFRVERQFT